ncbi:hypothetical protein PC110_g22509 [Phytophthora cactorum]|uniref:Integrase catalytic domain-containing protein n=1 Tax=Phytophthora cactorum TaxID=29920 RepID=A0A329R8E2_9STRA|nr:hypothetical protein C6341_g19510 [Phytophthora cactorum]RAW21047.1 hypothetical protein PC110_g22509 [Phytophthora cactorum]
MDFITDLPRTKRDVDSVWVVVDRLTKRYHFVPTTKKVIAERVARLFIDQIWKLHGMPNNIVSDRDRKFVFNFWQHGFKSIGTKLSLTVAHRAQGDGQTERMNHTLEEYLGCFVGPLQDDWDIHAECVVNTTVNSSIKLAPFEGDLGYIPLNPLQLAAEQLENVPKSQRGTEFHEHQAAILLRFCEALAQSQERMRDVYDHNRVEQLFESIGPYTAVRKVYDHAYELNIQTGNKLHAKMFHMLHHAWRIVIFFVAVINHMSTTTEAHHKNEAVIQPILSRRDEITTTLQFVIANEIGQLLIRV